MSALQSFAQTSPVIHGRKLRVLMAEAEPLRISRMLRSLFPDEESSLQLTTVSTISILLPTIQLVGPEVLFLDLSDRNHCGFPECCDRCFRMRNRRSS